MTTDWSKGYTGHVCVCGDCKTGGPRAPACKHEAEAERLRAQKEDLMVALREEGFELAAAMRMIDRRDARAEENVRLIDYYALKLSEERTALAQWRKAYETFEREGTMLALLRAYEGTHDG